eukprot:813046-Prorocentrum_minimum.AAC.1
MIALDLGTCAGWAGVCRDQKVLSASLRAAVQCGGPVCRRPGPADEPRPVDPDPRMTFAAVRGGGAVCRRPGPADEPRSVDPDPRMNSDP